MDLHAAAKSVTALSGRAVQGLSQFLPDWKQHGLLYIALALAVGFVLGRRRVSRVDSFQNRGEALMSRVTLTNFGPPDYHLMNHVTLQMSDGTTQIDHILVSRFGVFVIETKDFQGWIFANAMHASWTQVLFSWKFKFQNPFFRTPDTFGRCKTCSTSCRPEPSGQSSCSPAMRSS